MSIAQSLLRPRQTATVVAANVDVGAYTAVFTATTYGTGAIRVENTTDKVVKLAVGAAASEVDIPEYISPGVSKVIQISVAKGARLSCRAVDADATTGQLSVTLLG